MSKHTHEVEVTETETVTTPHVRWWRRHTVLFGALDPRGFDVLANDAFGVVGEETEEGLEVQA